MAQKDIRYKSFDDIFDELCNGASRIEVAICLKTKCNILENRWKHVYNIFALLYIITNFYFSFMINHYSGITDNAIVDKVETYSYVSLGSNILQVVIFYLLPYKKQQKYHKMLEMTMNSIFSYYDGLTQENIKEHSDQLFIRLYEIIKYEMQAESDITNQRNDYFDSHLGKKNGH